MKQIQKVMHFSKETNWWNNLYIVKIIQEGKTPGLNFVHRQKLKKVTKDHYIRSGLVKLDCCIDIGSKFFQTDCDICWQTANYGFTQDVLLRIFFSVKSTGGKQETTRKWWEGTKEQEKKGLCINVVRKHTLSSVASECPSIVKFVRV